MLERHLGKEQSTVASHVDEQTVTPDLDAICLNRRQRRENAEGNLQFGEFVWPNRKETRILGGSGLGGLDYRAVERRDRKNIAHTAPQLTSPIDRREHSTGFCEAGPRNNGKEGPIINRRFNGLMSQT
jgi:hypothetical protein